MSVKKCLLFFLLVFFSLGQVANAKNTITGMHKGKLIYTAKASENSQSIEISPVPPTGQVEDDDIPVLESIETPEQQQPSAAGDAQSVPGFFTTDVITITPLPPVQGHPGQWALIQQQGNGNPIVVGVPGGPDNVLGFQAVLDFLNSDDPHADLPPVNNILAMLHNPYVVEQLAGLITHPLVTPWNLRYYGMGTFAHHVLGRCFRCWSQPELATLTIPVATELNQEIPLGDNISQTITDDSDSNNGNVVINLIDSTSHAMTDVNTMEIVIVVPNSYEASRNQGIPLMSCKAQAGIKDESQEKDDRDKDGPGGMWSGIKGYLGGLRVVTWFSRGKSQGTDGSTTGGGGKKEKQNSAGNEYDTATIGNDTTSQVKLPLTEEPVNLLQLKVELDLSFPDQGKAQAAHHMETASGKAGMENTGYYHQQPAAAASY